jgi:hypothetical protein
MVNVWNTKMLILLVNVYTDKWLYCDIQMTDPVSHQRRHPIQMGQQIPDPNPWKESNIWSNVHKVGSTPRHTDWLTVSCKVTLTSNDSCPKSKYNPNLTWFFTRLHDPLYSSGPSRRYVQSTQTASLPEFIYKPLLRSHNNLWRVLDLLRDTYNSWGTSPTHSPALAPDNFSANYFPMELVSCFSGTLPTSGDAFSTEYT